MLRKTTANATARPAFTLIELLVVMAIIVVILSLVAGGIVGLITTQQQATTEDLFRTVDTKLRQHWNYVVAQAKKETPTDAVFVLAGKGNAAISNVAERAQVIHIKLRLMQAFPESFAEISPLPPYMNVTIPTTPPTGPVNLLPDNRYTATYKKALANSNSGGHQLATEPSACLLLSLSQARPNEASALKPDTLPTSAVGDTDGDLLKEFVDSWGQAINFERFPYKNISVVNELKLLYPSQGDPLDPAGTLKSPAWYNSKLRPFYEKILCNNSTAQPYTITGFYTVPTLSSSGPDQAFGTTDDLFSFRLRVGGHGD
jgi:prepilin-type N-terminal cleavage/methylation domain-containing protein